MNLEKIKEFLAQLNITKEGKLEGNKYVIDLGDSNVYSRIYTILDKNELVDLDVENITMNENESSMLYLSDDYDLTLKADFNENKYTLIIEEAKD